MVTTTDPAPTAFRAGVNSVSWLLIRFALVMVLIVLLVNGFTKGGWNVLCTDKTGTLTQDKIAIARHADAPP